MKRKILVLITDHFPCGTGEPFLESEIFFYKGFDKVFVFPYTYSKMQRKVPKEFIVLKSDTEKKVYSRNYQYLCSEIAYLYKRKELDIQNYSVMMEFYNKAKRLAGSILSELKKCGVSNKDQLVFYSYWMNAGALAAVMAAKRFKGAKSISRCHGIDLYEEENNGYLPFRTQLLKQLTYVFPISRDGQQHLFHKYGIQKHKIHICRLGSLCKKQARECDDRSVLKLVSCSSLITLKRIYLIVDILSKITDIPIEWTHFGGGPQHRQIEKMCEERLGSNVTYSLIGQVSNAEILRQYEERNYHLFINVSRTEGIPVSIMEAISFGIPVLATAVKGVPEIVIPGKNGYLLGENFEIQDAVRKIREIYQMPDEQYRMMRRGSRTVWEKRYDGEKNYRRFAKILWRLAGGKELE